MILFILLSLIITIRAQQAQWTFQNSTHIIKNHSWISPIGYPGKNNAVYSNQGYNPHFVPGFAPPPSKPNITYVWAPRQVPSTYNPGYQYQRINGTHVWAPVEIPVYSNYTTNGGKYKNYSNKNGNHLFVGTVEPMDICLYKEYFIKESKWYKGREIKIIYPKPNSYQDAWLRNRIITAIRCVDQYPNGKGGTCTIEQGGVGHKNVTINLRSTAGRALGYKVEIFGA